MEILRLFGLQKIDKAREERDKQKDLYHMNVELIGPRLLRYLRKDPRFTPVNEYLSKEGNWLPCEVGIFDNEVRLISMYVSKEERDILVGNNEKWKSRIYCNHPNAILSSNPNSRRGLNPIASARH